MDSEAAQEALTLLTLLDDPHDRVALRAWLSFESTTERRPGYRRVLALARDRDTDVGEVLSALDRDEIAAPYTGSVVERWRELQARLAELAPLREDLSGLIDALLPEHDDLAFLRQTARKALEEAGDLPALANALRYGVSQRETPLESTEVRVMSMHASKGLTADLVVIAGLVQWLIPRIDEQASADAQEADLQEQRRVFFVGITRTTNVLVLSGYSELDPATAFRLQVAKGSFLLNGNVRTFATSFLGELGEGLPEGGRGEEWDYT